ncbi:MAG TPA: ethanolamine ammonia-lyase subunit EutB [Gemmataceae bacterium]|jgi:ethanolamine ammonia-lyase large subunit|nr:ethanolamine ammonia-lyase subunit EutB [Gemmataceae bacterium]
MTEKRVCALTPLSSIHVPDPKGDEAYSGRFFDQTISFQNLKQLLGAADFSKAGDRTANLAAANEVAREAARCLLSELTLQHLYDRPLTDDEGRVDAVMRVNYDVDRDAFTSIASMTLGELKNHLLRAPGAEVQRIGRALTGVMAAALAKLCDVHELILVARKISHPTRARTLLGAPGTLSSRLQPNHPSDDLRGITLLCYWGLALGSGDALIGVNPAIDSVQNVSAILERLDEIRRTTGAPTQICVLAHIKTQLACLERGAPVEILFQSLAGTEKTNLSEFDISVDLLDRGYRTMAEKGPLRDRAEQFMYFETGQGSEFTYGKHNGIDMTTTEALCYGLARRYDPFMVNNVTGFIGPETHRDSFEMVLANLQDQFMGKLLGLPMGMAPCYTLHSHITLEGQQMATELLTAAGANYYMDVALNTDRMLAYFDTSGHDNQTLREICGRRPAPEFLEWAIEKQIFVRDPQGQVLRGPRWGQPHQFCASTAEFDELVAVTPAVYGFATAGPRPANEVSRQVKLHQAVGRQAIQAELRLEELQAITSFRVVETQAHNKEAHLNAPELGSRLSPKGPALLAPEQTQVQILVSDGLSAEAIHHNLPDLLPVLLDGLQARRLRMGQPILARYGRVKLAEPIADLLQTELVVYLIGERPGGDALAACSLSAYLVYRLADPAVQRLAAEFSGNPTIRFEYTVISNIYNGGLPPIEAGAVLAEKVVQILSYRAAGNRLEELLKAHSNSTTLAVKP